MPRIRPCPPARRLAPLAMLALCVGWPAASRAEVRRCTAADGSTIFTDKPCSSLEAVERGPPPASASGTRVSRTQCMRSVDDLVFEISLALDAGDANRLAGVYHWTGMSSRAAYDTVERLDRIASRPLVDVMAMYPEPSPPPLSPPPPPPLPATTPVERSRSYTDRLADRYGYPEPAEATGPPDADADAATADRTLDGEAAGEDTSVAPVRLPRPTGIRVVQTLSNGSTPSTTVFGLVRHFGCWWIRD